MKLRTIKLSGFKSFAESTHFSLPEQLVGVVGPNGCGKSNIMDAVRWVLGESKASELRGESMQDVIFNGTTTRKPASRASVELVFDNHEYRAGGQWRQFTEIAVKRVLTREGGSSYYINNQIVRRRDVQDVFLGTGLGPRAYAIIGQGTISRIIESRPEELRLFLEEAAGVSKYKERRRETEIRLHDTRENLLRVEDILRELINNSHKLEKQAIVAREYHHLQTAISTKQNTLWFLKRQTAQNNQLKIQDEGKSLLIDLEAQIAHLRALEATLETIRQMHYATGTQVNQAQGLLYEASSEVGRLEAEMRFSLERKTKAEQRQQTLTEQLVEWTQKNHDEQDHIAQIQGSLVEAQIRLEQLSYQLEEQAEKLPELESSLSHAQAKAQAKNQQTIQIQQQLRVAHSEQKSLSEQLSQIALRIKRITATKGELIAPNPTLLAQVNGKLSLAQQQKENIQAKQSALEKELANAEKLTQQQRQNLDEQTKKSTDISSKLEALIALQEKLNINEKLQPWLEKNELDHLPPLWQSLKIESGLEIALEAALRERLQAREVSRLDILKIFETDTPPTRLAFFDRSSFQDFHQKSIAPTNQLAGLRTLTSLVKSGDDGIQRLLNYWLGDYFIAQNLSEALAMRTALQPQQRIFIPNGHCIDAMGIVFYSEYSEQSGLLARVQEIENMTRALKVQSLIVEEENRRFLQLNATLSALKQGLTNAQQESKKTIQECHEIQLEQLKISQQNQQANQQQNQLGLDIQETTLQKEHLQTRLNQSLSQFESLDSELKVSQEQYTVLQDKMQEAQDKLKQFKDQNHILERQEQEIQFQIRHTQTRLSELKAHQATLNTQITHLQQESLHLQEETKKFDAQTADTKFQDALEVKVGREKALTVIRTEYDRLTYQIRTSDEKRMLIENTIEPSRKKITELQLKEQAEKIAIDQFDQFLQKANANLEELQTCIENDPSNAANPIQLQSDLDALNIRLSSLGAVNLAAIEELAQSTERKNHLNAQFQDLNKAISTLKDAVRKIDTETRNLLKNTFDQVNLHFGQMFPELFGGGAAKLLMTGDEILDAGVQVIAQPPGKRNQTIHLLSGGEKALTAIALVFAIFQLNPAPFCLLDEVDAPLDDANTERYAKLVTKMSTGTQFLFISHNKIAMEMAQLLVGVTMQEQGVSRMVAVNMESAINFSG